jgi:hypothetical protein
MFRSVSRWRWLTILAICNLLLWVGMAVAVGLTIGGKVDLGVETFIREHRATAVAIWDQAATKAADALGKPAPGDTVLRPAKAGAPADGLLTPTVRSKAPTAQPTTRAQAAQPALRPSTSTPQPPPGATPSPEPKETPVRSPLLLADPDLKNLARLDTELSRSAVGRAVQIRYQEEALNSAIAALVENNPKLPYQHVQVDLQRDRVVVTGSANVLGFPLSTKVVGTVTVQDCLPQIEVQSVSIAGVFTPSFVQDRITDMILEAMAWYPPDYPLCLQQIVLEDGRATVYGFRR